MPKNRLVIIQVCFVFAALIVVSRLFYWQILSGDKLDAIAQAQRESIREVPGNRGEILASDGFPLVTNQPSYLLYAYLPQIKLDAHEIATKLSPILINSDKTQDSQIKDVYMDLSTKLSSKDKTWVSLSKNISEENKQMIESLNIGGLGFDKSQKRYYPEASMAAQLLGFVASDEKGNPRGYFGLEGKYDLELKGKSGFIRQEQDAQGKPIIIGDYEDISSRNGRTLKTHIDRGLQLTIENKLLNGLVKYGAVSGEVVLMDPNTGGILAMASYPNYEPSNFIEYNTAVYKLPSIADTYEPGSTFKSVVMASAIDAKLINPNSTCGPECNGPVQIANYNIKTWNEQYHPGQTMTQVLERSDNTGMVYVARQLGTKRFLDYIKRFGIGEPTQIDLQSETVLPLKNNWGEIDLATGSFGQGLAVTSIQMLRAVGAIANDGKLMEPHVVSQIISETETIDIKPKIVRQVISKESADTVTEMMVAAVKSGEAKWISMKDYRIAGKTGTAQIPIAGHYDKDRTIASFVGFAPADNPKFVMIVKLQEPKTSTWASETAAPLWMEIAKDLFYYFRIAPDNS